MITVISSIANISMQVPFYVSFSYSQKYKNEGKAQGILEVAFRFFVLLKELCFTIYPTKIDFEFNASRYEKDFKEMNSKLDQSQSTKPIFAYFIANADYNGAILGYQQYYDNHYKISKFQNHYDVAAKIVSGTDEIFQFLGELKAKHPNREIKAVLISCHGCSKGIILNQHNKVDGRFDNTAAQKRTFEHCAKDAAIIFEACNTGKGDESFANNIALHNPGKTVFAPTSSIYTSILSFRQNDNGTVTVSNVHDVFGIAQFKKFYMPSEQCA